MHPVESDSASEAETEAEAEAEAEATDVAEQEDAVGDVKREDREKSAASVRGASMHKRSASVLSAVSDKSAKRQKK